MKTTITAFLLCLSCAAAAGAQNIQIAGQYLFQHAHTVGNQNMYLNGGRADVAVGLKRHFALVGEFAGVYANGQGVNGEVYTYLGGLRYQRPIVSERKPTRAAPFMQFLVGGAYATNGAFPKNGQLQSNANSFAYSASGGMDIKLNRMLALRVVQADYLFSQLPNLVGTHQSNLRLGIGIVFTLKEK